MSICALYTSRTTTTASCAYWFEEPSESSVDLQQLYERNIHNQSERRFTTAAEKSELAGSIEVVEINRLHLRCEFQVGIYPSLQGSGYTWKATRIAVGNAFIILNIHKLYLHVDKDNSRTMHIYESCCFHSEELA